MLNKFIEPASDIRFLHPETGRQYLSLSMAQVESLRDRKRFDKLTAWARERHTRVSNPLAPRNARFFVKLQADGAVLVTERDKAPRRWLPAQFVSGQGSYDERTEAYPDYVHAELWRQHDTRQRDRS